MIDRSPIVCPLQKFKMYLNLPKQFIDYQLITTYFSKDEYEFSFG